VPLEAAIPLILGANIGTCGTALLAAIGKSAEAARVGVVHLLFNVIGVFLFVFLIPQVADFVRLISPSAPNSKAQRGSPPRRPARSPILIPFSAWSARWC
jgi:Na+/phosphate symporter